MAAVKRGLKHGLWVLERTVVLMLDETIVTETPPLYGCYGHEGVQTRIPITGNRAKRILHGVLNVVTGEILLLITYEWNHETHQYFLKMIRSHWRGWNLVLFEDKGSPHTARSSRALANTLGIQRRLLPRATPELNAMDHLWRHVKKEVVGNSPIESIDRRVDRACAYLLEMDPRERLKKAGVLSGNFWLTT